MKGLKLKKLPKIFFTLTPFIFIGLVLSFSIITANYKSQSLTFCQNSSECQVSNIRLTNGCGSGSGHVQTSINFGCNGNPCPPAPQTTNNPPYCSTNHNGIIDLMFAIIRFLSDGVGLVVIASIVIGGVQYIVSRGEPNETQKAIKRLTSALLALVIYIFAYAILNYVIPNGLLHQ
jgi:hypothetical protein